MLGGWEPQTFKLKIEEIECLLNLDFKFSFSYGFKTVSFLSEFLNFTCIFPGDVFQTWKGNETASPLNYSFIPSALSLSPP